MSSDQEDLDPKVDPKDIEPPLPDLPEPPGNDEVPDDGND